MRRKKIEGILCLTGMLLLTGCGTKAYDLTEAEESQIVNYAVHVVSKHNSYQKDGLVYVDQSAEETEPEETVTEWMRHQPEIRWRMYLERMDWKLPMEE